VGTLRFVNSAFASAFPSKCATLNRPCSVGMRSSPSGTSFRVSSNVDQMTCCSPACCAACAIARASAISRSAEKWSQKNVTQYAPYAPAKARSRLAASSTSAATTSAPSAASARALSELASRVSARAVNGPFASAMMARTSPPPCAPVAPTTAMIFFSSIVVLLECACGVERRSERGHAVRRVSTRPGPLRRRRVRRNRAG